MVNERPTLYPDHAACAGTWLPPAEGHPAGPAAVRRGPGRTDERCILDHQRTRRDPAAGEHDDGRYDHELHPSHRPVRRHQHELPRRDVAARRWLDEHAVDAAAGCAAAGRAASGADASASSAACGRRAAAHATHHPHPPAGEGDTSSCNDDYGSAATPATRDGHGEHDDHCANDDEREDGHSASSAASDADGHAAAADNYRHGGPLN